MMDVCVLCEQSLESGQSISTLTERGCAGIVTASEQRGVDIHPVPGQKVHQKCRKTFCHPKYIELDNKKRGRDEAAPGPSTRRSSGVIFQYGDHCLFCGQCDKYEGKKPAHKLIPVKTTVFQDQIKAVCATRTDTWAKTVNSRIEYIRDLFAADAVYHGQCSINFRTGRQIPQQFVTDHDDVQPQKRFKQGRPKDIVKSEAFTMVAEYLESHDDEQTTINSLIDKMAEYLPSDIEPYGFTHMKTSIQNHFGDKIVITEINGKPNVVTFRHTASSIIDEFYSQPKGNNPQSEKNRIIQTAAKLIKSDIKSVTQPTDTYPTTDQMSSLDGTLDFLPESLQLLLGQLFVGKNTSRKIASIGQAIMQAVRPRVLLAPLQLGLAVQLHYHYGSRFLIDTLNEHGFCSHYREVQHFERNAALIRGTDIPNFTPESQIQYMADNVDHNVRTLDGMNTFHGMGIIATVTPSRKSVFSIPRAAVNFDDIEAVGRLDIRQLISPCSVLPELIYESLDNISYPDHSCDYVEMLYNISLHLRMPRPSWSGMMQMVHQGEHPGTASVLFLPMIDLDPGNPDCIYSTLLFICDHAKRYGVTPMLTFDQPLWWKALNIISNQPQTSELHSVILRLGGFHTLMSYLGCIGHIMEGSGLQHLLNQVYSSNTVKHMLTGKAYDRAVRGHLLVAGALQTMLTSNALQVPLPSSPADTESAQSLEHRQPSTEQPVAESTMDKDQEDPEGQDDAHAVTDQVTLQHDQGSSSNICTNEQLLIDATELFDNLLAGNVHVTELNRSDVLEKISDIIQCERERLSESRTAKLWLQYLDMIDIMRRFIRSERMGDWLLHLRTLRAMLPYLAAAGHHLYAKSLHIYLQRMSTLAQTNPGVYNIFQDGRHVVRRSDRLWAGLSSDLVIEQVLMRSLKTSGGLTRGRGMDERQRLVWVLSSPVCAEVNHAMQAFTGVNYNTSDQHKDLSAARQERDLSDTKKLLTTLTTRTPFTQDGALCSLDTGVCAEEHVNADKALVIGERILNGMVGKTVSDYKFKKTDQVVTMLKKTTVRIGSDTIDIDPQLLFQRLVTAGMNSGELEIVFRYELCSYPPAMFDAPRVMSEANKSALMRVIKKNVPEMAIIPPDDVHYVLDGGSLIHRIPWESGKQWKNICERYTQYVVSRFGQATVVFDGYQTGPTTKDGAHVRRSKCRVAPDVNFTPDMTCSLEKEVFLSNTKNKQHFINMLSDNLKAQGCNTLHAPSDADVLMVKTTVRLANDKSTVLVGDDTDLLVLLCCHTSDTPFKVYFRPEPKSNSRMPAICWDIHVVQQHLGPDICNSLLFLHAISGCDTTSRLFGIGKTLPFKKAKHSEFLLEQAAVFNSKETSQNNIVAAGERALVHLYGGEPSDSLDNLRLQMFHQKVSSSTVCVQPRSLPPTSSAAKQHSLRVYHQVQQWCTNELPAEDWGWTIEDGKMTAIMTDMPPAPSYLLESIHCNCKSGCTTRRCGCRKYGLECSLACGGCKGLHCTNVTLSEYNECDQE